MDSKIISKYARLLFALFIISASYNLFIVPLGLVAGGSGGLGVLFNRLFGLDYSYVIFIFSVLMFVLALFVLDLDEILSVFLVTIFYPLFVKITFGISNYIYIDNSQVLVMVLFGGIITGIGQGLIFKDGLNFGGFSVLAKVINKYTKISVPLCNTIINAVIIFLGAFYTKFSMILYAIVYIYITRIVSEKVMLGNSNNKTFKIISSKYERIEKYIHSLGHDVTLYDTVGAYKGDAKKLIMTVVPNSHFIMIKDYVKSVDKKAFIFVTNTYDVAMQDNSSCKGKI